MPRSGRRAACVAWRPGPTARRRGLPRAPAPVRRLVAAEGQAGPRRAPAAGGGPRGGRGDRRPGGAAGTAAHRRATAARAARRRSTTGRCGRPATGGFQPATEVDDVRWLAGRRGGPAGQLPARRRGARRVRGAAAGHRARCCWSGTRTPASGAPGPARTPAGRSTHRAGRRPGRWPRWWRWSARHACSSASARRCVQTLDPAAALLDLPIEVGRRLRRAGAAASSSTSARWPPPPGWPRWRAAGSRWRCAARAR